MKTGPMFVVNLHDDNNGGGGDDTDTDKHVAHVYFGHWANGRG
jgi:hypothetical protein